MPVFESKYAIEEIEKNFNAIDFLECLKKSPEEAFAYEKGNEQQC